jgi:UDP-GlcNAc3NAcA epimerase
MKIVTVVGARPQFIKAAPVSRALQRAGLDEVLVHTGQHYDSAMSDIFFESLGIAQPRHHLGVGSGPHGAQTGRILEGVEQVLLDERPDALLVFGDTNSTLAAGLAAAKLHIPVAHVEAGLRSFNRRMPEEVNRVLVDHLSTLLFAPTDAAIENLRNEGMTRGVIRTGDVMYDAFRLFRDPVRERAGDVLRAFDVQPGRFAFMTLHRAENTDDPERWRSIQEGVRRVAEEVVPVLWAVHPRVAARVRDLASARLRLIEPQPYFETQALLMHARFVLTDSGGLQKEAAFHETPCITMRDETEWVELVQLGVNRLTGADAHAIVAAAAAAEWPQGVHVDVYGDGTTSDRIAQALLTPALF